MATGSVPAGGTASDSTSTTAGPQPGSGSGTRGIAHSSGGIQHVDTARVDAVARRMHGMEHQTDSLVSRAKYLRDKKPTRNGVNDRSWSGFWNQGYGDSVTSLVAAMNAVGGAATVLAEALRGISKLYTMTEDQNVQIATRLGSVLATSSGGNGNGDGDGDGATGSTQTTTRTTVAGEGQRVATDSDLKPDGASTTGAVEGTAV